MTTADVLLLDFDNEIAHTRQTLERVPDVPDYLPHPKSMPLGKLAMHCASIPRLGTAIMEDEGMDMASTTRLLSPLVYTTREACLAELEASAAQCRAAIAACSDERLAEPWRFRFGDHVILDRPRSFTYRQVCFNHLIHHVAQLGVYLRLNNIPLPGLYGASADENMAPPAAP